ncbi:MAG: GNAT family N-acetyltransferase [Lachnospiraceae bacterium]|nr:GNAT family N-acetyltransferase [Lachnospiraceae bacterium]MDE7021641.1 GNAT family N-acetyltransferase [Lachnospiraceae bacterium]
MTRQIPYQIRNAYRDEWDDAMTLAWKTFMKFEADIYTDEGIQNFEDFITDTTLHRMFLMGVYQMFVALDRKQIVGMLTLRNNSHISLLFVDEKYHRRGIGRALIEYLREYLLSEAGISKVTVNAAPYGVAFYHKLGFQDLRPEEERDGIRYTPMEFVL